MRFFSKNGRHRLLTMLLFAGIQAAGAGRTAGEDRQMVSVQSDLLRLRKHTPGGKGPEGAKVVLRLVPGVSRQRHQCGSQHPGRRKAAAEKERNARKRVNAISKEPWGARG